MLPIVVKDLRENLKTWIVFSVLAVASILLSSSLRLTPERQDMVEGFVCSLVLASSLIFTHNVVVSERKRRHFVFLKSLPIEDRTIVLAKFVSVALLTGTLGNLPFLILFALRHETAVGAWSLANGILLFYSSLMLFCSIRFQNPAVLFLPLYLMVGLVLLPEGLHEEMGMLFQVVLQNPLLLLGLSGGAATLCLLASIHAFRSKELDF